MSPAEAIASLPGETRVSVLIGGEGMTVDELRAALADSGPVYITTEEASRRFSRSPKWWARQAPHIPGAYRDRMWRLPLAGCEEHLARLVRPKRTRRKRGPWFPKEAAPPQAAGDRSAGLQAR